MESLGEKIYYLRTDAGISQDELAEKLDVSRQTVSRWETDMSRPTQQNISRMGKVFGVDKSYFVSDGYFKEKDTFDYKKAVILLSVVSCVVIIAIIAFAFTGATLIPTQNMIGMNLRIVNRFKALSILCFTVGGLLTALLIAGWIVLLVKLSKKSKK